MSIFPDDGAELKEIVQPSLHLEYNPKDFSDVLPEGCRFLFDQNRMFMGPSIDKGVSVCGVAIAGVVDSQTTIKILIQFLKTAVNASSDNPPWAGVNLFRCLMDDYQFLLSLCARVRSVYLAAPMASYIHPDGRIICPCVTIAGMSGKGNRINFDLDKPEKLPSDFMPLICVKAQ